LVRMTDIANLLKERHDLISCGCCDRSVFHTEVLVPEKVSVNEPFIVQISPVFPGGTKPGFLYCLRALFNSPPYLNIEMICNGSVRLSDEENPRKKLILPFYATKGIPVIYELVASDEGGLSVQINYHLNSGLRTKTVFIQSRK